MAIIVNDKGALVTSNAGMRLIAQQTLLNKGDFERLRAFITESYAPPALETQSHEARLRDLRTLAAEAGKLRVYQVIGADKHRVIVLLESERGPALYMTQLAVEEDYPHRITQYTHQLLAEIDHEDSGA